MSSPVSNPESSPMPIQHDEVPIIIKEAGFVRSDACPMGAISYTLGEGFTYDVRCYGWSITEQGACIMIQGDLIGLIPRDSTTDYSEMLERLEQECKILPNEITWAQTGDDNHISVSPMLHINAADALPSTTRNMLREASATLFEIAITVINSGFEMGYDPGTTSKRDRDPKMEMTNENEFRRRIAKQRSTDSQPAYDIGLALQDGSQK